MAESAADEKAQACFDQKAGIHLDLPPRTSSPLASGPSTVNSLPVLLNDGIAWVWTLLGTITNGLGRSER